MRTILKYRLYGRDGVTNREFNRLVEWGVIQKKAWENKGIVKKDKKETDGSDSEIPSDYSYLDNSVGDPIINNDGYEIMPILNS
jgi:hypothetical protein